MFGVWATARWWDAAATDGHSTHHNCVLQFTKRAWVGSRRTTGDSGLTPPTNAYLTCTDNSPIRPWSAC